MKFKLKVNKFKKPTVILSVVLFLFTFILSSFLVTPPSLEALTDDQANRRAEKWCVDDGNSVPGIEEEPCKESYRAGATGKAMPDWCQDEESDDMCQKAYREGKKVDAESKDPNKRSGGDQKEAEQFCEDAISLGTRKQDCERGYIAGLKGEKSPCPDGDGGKQCREGFNEGKKQRRQNDPKRADCDDSTKPEECKKEFDKCDQLQGPNIANAVRQCKIEALKSFPDESGGDQSDKNVDCDATFSSSLSWIACPIIDIGVDMTDTVFENIIKPMLENVPVTADPENGVYIAWQQFRLIANVLLVGSLLVIVYSQARGGK
jgi:hypothetical protein